MQPSDQRGGQPVYPSSPSSGWNVPASVGTPGQDWGRGEQAPAPPPSASGGGPAVARPRRVGRIVAAVAVVGAVVGAGVGVGTYAALNSDNGTSTTAGLSVSSQQARANAPASGVSAVAAKLKPSVVTIDAVGAQQAGTGSGVILRRDGYILTNDHVVSLDGSQSPRSVRLTVVFDNGATVPAHVVGADATDDLAVIKVNRTGLAPVVFARSSRLSVGQPVVAIGAPLGLSDTVTSGIVSALDRPVQTGTSGQAIFDAVQTDAAINPGNSGGPLVDLKGQVVGINSAIASTNQGPLSGGQSGNIGIGFAIPSDEATRVAGQLITSGKATHAELGIDVSSAPGRNSVAPTSAAGAQVARVNANSPAAKAGIKAGDLITAVGRQRIDDPVTLVAAVRSHTPGQSVDVQLIRNGKPMTVSVTLASQTS